MKINVICLLKYVYHYISFFLNPSIYLFDHFPMFDCLFDLYIIFCCCIVGCFSPYTLSSLCHGALDIMCFTVISSGGYNQCSYPYYLEMQQ